MTMVTNSRADRTLPRSHDRPDPAELAEFHAVVPAMCPTCGGSLKDYNAETVVTAPGVSLTHSPGLLSHLYVCQGCGKKILAPPRLAIGDR